MSSRISMLPWWVAAWSASLILGTGQARAEAATSPPTPDTSQTASTSSGGLEEILVTARRREEKLQDVPLAVTAFTQAELEERGITSVIQLNGSVPGMTITSGFGQGRSVPVFSIRGQTSQE